MADRFKEARQNFAAKRHDLGLVLLTIGATLILGPLVVAAALHQTSLGTGFVVAVIDIGALCFVGAAFCFAAISSLRTFVGVCGVIVVVGVVLAVVFAPKVTHRHLFAVPQGAAGNGIDFVETVKRPLLCKPSKADPDRTSAYFCYAASRQGIRDLFDPCYVINTPMELVCPLNPWQTVNTVRGVEWEGAGIKKASVRGFLVGSNSWTRPWALRLEGGDKCLFAVILQSNWPSDTRYVCFKAAHQVVGFLLEYPEENVNPWAVLFESPDGRTSTASVADAWK
jgi:hypothetical protein